MSTKYHAVIAGASGVVGLRLAHTLAAEPQWRVTGLSRRAPAHASFNTIAVDLTDARDSHAKLASLAGATHIFYAARYDHKTTAPEPVDINTNMLRHLVEAIEPHAPNLQHIHIVEGSKYYGSTLGPYKNPADESDPRVPNNANFYYAQEDWLFARQQDGNHRRWTWSASRPHAVCDFSTGFARQLALLIAVYAHILKAEGEPLHFPGSEGNYHALYQCTEAGLLARAMRWMALEPRCANQAYNITNGDLIRWSNLWPMFAAYFGMQCGSVQPIQLGAVMPGKAAAWLSLSSNYCLKTITYDKLVIWPYGDFVFGPAYDIASSTIKARRHGFHECMDTGRMFIELFDYYRRERVTP